MKKINHKEYISSPYWRRFSKKILDDPEVECEMCHRKKWSIYKRNTKKHKTGDKKRLIVLNLHHTDYENLGVGEDHVIPLCRRCHSLSHDIERAGSIDTLWGIVYDFLINNSSWDYKQAGLYQVPDELVLSQKREKKDEE
jgi:hypothetical protein